jgi:uncharacterized membrane protein (UPF0127 family)
LNMLKETPKRVAAKTASGLKKKNRNLAFSVAVLLVVFVLMSVFFVRMSGSCSEKYKNDVTVKTPVGFVSAQNATTLSDQEKGLGNRECLGTNQAMLFNFDKPGYYLFWMKDMKFNLDIIWLSPDKSVNHIEKNLSPSSYPKTFGSDSLSTYVLEVNAGTADRLKIKTGSHLVF